MSDIVQDSASFEHTGNIADVPPRDDVKTNKTIADETDRINRERIKGAVRESLGDVPVQPAPVGNLTKDHPQLVFRIVADMIGCKRFELSDGEASVMATHLNVLIPLSGKMASVVAIAMITLNKVWVCMDAIKAKFAPKEEKTPAQAAPDNLPEPLS